MSSSWRRWVLFDWDAFGREPRTVCSGACALMWMILEPNLAKWVAVDLQEPSVSGSGTNSGRAGVTGSSSALAENEPMRVQVPAPLLLGLTENHEPKAHPE